MNDSNYVQSSTPWPRHEPGRYRLGEVDPRIGIDSAVWAEVTSETDCFYGREGIVVSIPGGKEPWAYVRFWGNRSPERVPLRALRLA